MGLITSGKWSLKYKQTPPLRKLEGCSQPKSLYTSIGSLGSSDEIEESKKVSVRQKRYQINGRLKRLKLVRVWGSLLPKYCLNSNDKQTRSSSTHPAQDWPQYPRLHDDTIAINMEHVKKKKNKEIQQVPN